jgi:trimeric autotransporter adhesin
VGSASVTDVSVVCAVNTFTLGGTVSGLSGTVILQRAGGEALSISANGDFAFPTPVVEGSSYAVSVKTQPSGGTCTVTQGSGVVGSASVTNIAVVCVGNAFAINGMVSGLIGAVVLQNNGADTQTISTDGAFTFSTPVTQGKPYAVTVLTQPTDQTCSVGSGTGTMGAAKVITVAVVCSTNTFSVGGTVSGLSGTVVMQDNGADSTVLNTDGSFTFSSSVAEGSTYSITVQTQPAAQSCTVVNGSGTMGGSNVTNVTVACTTNTTTLSVSATGTIPVNNGSGTLTVTNTGTTYTAYNVYAALPPGWIAVTQDTSNCSSIAPNGGPCTLTFTSTAPYVAQGGIVINGDNITSQPTTALAFTIDDYLVFSVDSLTSASVIDTADLATAQWGTIGIAVGVAAQSLTDGASNTSAITGTVGVAPSAADDCDLSTNGGVTVGTWYLPAICQLGGASEGAGCPQEWRISTATCSSGASAG